MDANIVILIKRWLKGWKTVAITTVAGAVLGVAVAFLIPKQYTVTTQIAPESQNGKGQLGSLSSLVSLTGINVNSLNNTDALYPEIYPDIVKSSPFIAELMAMPVILCEDGDSIKTNLYAFKLGRKGLNGSVEIPESFDYTCLSKREDRVMRSIRKDISVKVDKKTQMVTIKVKSKNPVVAADLSNAIIDNLKEYVLDYYYDKAAANLEYYSSMTEQARADYFEAQEKYARCADANQGVTLQSAMIRQQRLKSEMLLSGQLFDQLSKKEQAAKVKIQENRPVLAVIQPATVPYKGKPSKFMMGIIAGFIFFALSSVWVMFFKEEFRNDKKKAE